MKIPCAFHKGQMLTHFCHCEACLLPLCTECLTIHRKEHTSMPEVIRMLPIDNTIANVSESIINEMQNVRAISFETHNKMQESEEIHKIIVQQIAAHKEALMNSIHNVYDNFFLQLEESRKRRFFWMQEFGCLVNELEEELIMLKESLSGEKNLRTVIMWNRLKPNETIGGVYQKSKKNWATPTFSAFSEDTFLGFLISQTNLKVMEIEGDSGVRKILDLIKILRYGEEETKPNNYRNDSLINKNINGSLVKTSSSLNLHHPQQQNPVMLSPINRKNSNKKIEVFSNLENFRSHPQASEGK